MPALRLRSATSWWPARCRDIFRGTPVPAAVPAHAAAKVVETSPLSPGWVSPPSPAFVLSGGAGVPASFIRQWSGVAIVFYRGGMFHARPIDLLSGTPQFAAATFAILLAASPHHMTPVACVAKSVRIFTAIGPTFDCALQHEVSWPRLQTAAVALHDGTRRSIDELQL